MPVRPLSKKFFGSDEGSIAIRFVHNGSFIDGYVVKQKASNIFQVSDGNVTKNVGLTASHTNALRIYTGAGDLSDLEGQSTIIVGPGMFIRKISTRVVNLTNGDSVKWATAYTSDGIIMPSVQPPAPGLSTFFDFSLAGNSALIGLI
jgi:hypothetical protein